MLKARRGVTAMVMAREMVTIEIDPESDLRKALAMADEQPRALASNGRRFGVRPIEDDDPWADYDPERVRAVGRASAGALTPEEGERLKQDIYRWREEGTKPSRWP
jgi:hypothetical protein